MKTWFVVTKYPVWQDDMNSQDVEMGLVEVAASSRKEALKEGVRQLKEKHPNYFLMEHNPFGQVFAELISHCNTCQHEFGENEDIFVVKKPVPYNANIHLCRSCYVEAAVPA